MICILVATTIAANMVRLELTDNCYATRQQCLNAVPAFTRTRPVIPDRPEAFRCVREERAV